MEPFTRQDKVGTASYVNKLNRLYAILHKFDKVIVHGGNVIRTPNAYILEIKNGE